MVKLIQKIVLLMDKQLNYLIKHSNKRIVCIKFGIYVMNEDNIKQLKN